MGLLENMLQHEQQKTKALLNTSETEDFTVQDADTFGGKRLTGVDAPESFVKSSKAKRIAEDYGVDLQTQQLLGNRATDFTKELLKRPDMQHFQKTGVGVFGRDLISNPPLEDALLESLNAVPYDRYDSKKQELYRRTLEKEQKLTGTNRELEALQGIRQYNLDKKDQGFLDSLGRSVDALQAGAIETGGSFLDLVGGIVAKGAEIVGADETAKSLDEMFDEIKSAEFAEEFSGYDSREVQFAQQEAVHQVKLGNYAKAFQIALTVAPETIARSLPYMLEMMAGIGGKAKLASKGLKKITDIAKRNVGFATVVGQETNNQIEEFTANNDGVSPNALKTAEIVGTNVLMLGLDRMAFKDILSAKDGLKAIAAKLPKSTKAELAKKATGVVANVTAAGAKEGAQEYAQTWGEILNTQVGAKGQTLADVASDEEFQREALGGGLLGAGAGTGLSVGANVAKGTPKAIKKAKKTVKKEITKQDAEEKAEADIQVAKEGVETSVEQTKLQQDYDTIKGKIENAQDIKTEAETVRKLINNIERIEDQELKTKVEDLRTKVELEKTFILSAIKKNPDISTKELEDELGKRPIVLGSSEAAKQAILETTNEKEIDKLAEIGQVDKETVNNIKELNEAKKSIDAVEKDVTSGPSGYQTYFKQLIEADVQKDEGLKESALTNLNRLSTIQKNKLTAISSAITELEKSIAEGGKDKKIVKGYQTLTGASELAANRFVDRATGEVKVSDRTIELRDKIQASVSAMDTILAKYQPDIKADIPVEETQVEVPVEKVIEPVTETDTQEVTPIDPLTTTEEQAAIQEVEKSGQRKQDLVQEEISQTIHEKVDSKKSVEAKKGTDFRKLQAETSGKLRTKTKEVGSVLSEVMANYGARTKNTLSSEAGKALRETRVKESPIHILYNEEGQIDERTQEAIAYGVENYIAEALYNTRYNDDGQIKKMLGLDEGTEVPPFIAERLRGAGRFHKLEAQSIGKKILKTLGLKQVESEDRDFQSRLETDVGAIAIGVMEKQGWLQYSNELSINEIGAMLKGVSEYNNPEDYVTITPEHLDKAREASKVKVPTVRAVLNSGMNDQQYNVHVDRINSARELLNTIKDELQDGDIISGYRTFKRSKRKHTVRGMEQETVIPDKQQKVLNKLENRNYTVNTSLIDNLAQMYEGQQDKLLEVLGTVDPETVHVDKREDVKAKNDSIKRSIEMLFSLRSDAKAVKSGIYFDWFFSKNGRFFIDSPTINPQTDKFHRFAMNEKPDVEVKTEEHRDMFKLGVVQAFDGGGIRDVDSEGNNIIRDLGSIDKQTLEASKEQFEALMEANNEAIEAVKRGEVNHPSVMEALDGTDHPVHALLALKEMGKYSEETFSTNMVLESDAVTSGFILGLATNPVMDYEILKKWLAKGGVWLGGTDKDSYGAYRAENEDSYATSMKGVEKALQRLPEAVKQWIPINRSLMKKPFMVFMYGAGVKGIKNSLGYEYADKLISMLSSTSKEEFDKGVAVAKELGVDINTKAGWKRVSANIRNTSVQTNPKLRELYAKARHYVEETYGEAIAGYLQAGDFAPLVDMRKVVNRAFVTMFKQFKADYDKRMSKTGKSKEEADKVINDMMLEGKVPGIFTYYSEEANEKAVIMNNEPITGERASEAKVTARLKGMQVNNRTINPLIREYLEAPSSGAVISIHWLDGSIMANTLDQNKVLGVHDAAVSAVDKALTTAKDYNEAVWNITQNYNVVEEIIKQLEDVYKVDEKKIKPLRELNKKIVENKERMRTEGADVEHMALAGSMYKQEGLQREVTEGSEVVPTITVKSDPKITQEGTYDKIADTINNDPDVMLALYEELGRDDRIDISEAHDKHLQRVLYMMVNKTRKFIPEMQIKLAEDALLQGGVTDIGTDTIWLNKGSQPQISKLDKSMKEVYVHELVHAATEYAKQLNAPAVSGTLRRLRRLQDQALKKLTWEDLMPQESLYDRLQDEAEAKALYKYISQGDATLSEFIALGMTNESVRKALSGLSVYNDETGKNNSLVGRLLTLFSNLMDWIMQKARQEKGIKADRLLQKLSLELAEANNKATRHVRKGLVQRGLDSLLNDGIEPLNKEIIRLRKKYMEKWFDSDVPPALPEDSNIAQEIWWLVRYAARATQDEKAAKVWLEMLRVLGAPAEGTIQSVLRGFQDPDELMRTLERWGLLSNKIDQIREIKVREIAKASSEAFSRMLSNVEQTALGVTLLETDMEILGDLGYKRLEELLKDDTKIDQEIGIELDKLTSDKNFYHTYAEGLGWYMAKHEIKRADQGMNARLIAEKVMHGGKDNVSQGTIDAIDRIATLYGIKYTEKAARDMTAKIMNAEPEGIEQVFKLQRQNKLVAKKALFADKNDWMNMIKGYTKEVFDRDISVQIAPISDRKQLEAEGFKLVEVLQKSEEDTSHTPMALYTNELHITPNYNRYNMRIVQKKSKGTTLTEIHAADDDGTYNAHKVKQSINNVKNRHRREKRAMNGRYTPIDPKAKYLAPVLNSKGEIVNYRYMMSKYKKAHVLKRDMRVHQLLGRTMATTFDKTESKRHNREVIDIAYKDYTENYSKNPKDYIEVSLVGDNAEAIEAWKLLPSDAKNWAKKRFNSDRLVIRRDMFYNYLGQRQASVSNTAAFRKAPKVIREHIRMAEHIIREIVKISKVDIVIKTPAVLVQNIVSNLIWSVELGMNPIEVAKMQWEGVHELREYRKNYHEAEGLRNKKNAGIKIDEGRLARLEERMDASVVRDLMEEGLFQAIMEDVDVVEVEQPSKVRGYIERKRKQAPKWVQTAIDYSYMTENTGVFKAMLKMTQYSDFVARYALYQKKLRDGMDKKQARQDVIDAFINYDIPDSKLIQYANDMGFIMFTKYFLRIQRAIRKGLIDEKPVQAMISILFQGAIYDFEDPLDASLWEKSYGNIAKTYDEHIYNMVMPSGWEAGYNFLHGRL